MIAARALEDYNDFVAMGLTPSLQDFDRLNSLALRLENGAKTTSGNFPRIGWAGNIPFYEPTCAALIWYLSIARNLESVEDQNAAWYYALAHGRKQGAFDKLENLDEVLSTVKSWLSTLPVTLKEISRACYYAAHGFDDAIAGLSPTAIKQTIEESISGKLDALHNLLLETVAVLGLTMSELQTLTPHNLTALKIEAAKKNGLRLGFDKGDLQRDYDLARREIYLKLKEKENG